MQWVCKICGYVHDDDDLPELCPVCGAPKNRFEKFVEENKDSLSNEANKKDDDLKE